MNPDEHLSQMLANCCTIEDTPMDDSGDLANALASSSLSDIDCDEVERLERVITPFAPSTCSSSDTSMRSVCLSPSVISVTPSIREASYIEQYGRLINSRSQVYVLPADADEYDRLDGQHTMFKKIMGEYPPGMHECMRWEDDDEDEDDQFYTPKSCLDVGMGSAAWIEDVCKRWPLSKNVAVDLVPCHRTDLPGNLQAEIDDVNMGLEHFGPRFNVVHARLISTGVCDYLKFVDQASQILRPRGLLALMEYNFVVYDAEKKVVPVDLSLPGDGQWLARWMAFVKAAVRRRGGDVDAASQISLWVDEHPSYEDVVAKDYWVPTSPWFERMEETEIIFGIANSLRDDMLAFINSAEPLLLMDGFEIEALTELENNVRNELLDCTAPGFVLIQTVSARRIP